MTMVVVASYLSLPDAQVAASVLRSAGLAPILFDEQQSYARWPLLFGIGGCRLAVNSAELADALALLAHTQEPLDHGDLDPRRGWWARVIASSGVFLLTPILGWLVLGVSDRRGRWSETLLGIASASALVGGMIALSLVLEFLVTGGHGAGYRY